MDLEDLRSFLSDHLNQQVVPFWLEHGVDWEHGGIYTFMRDDGTLVKRDKSIISNTRALWSFSALACRSEDADQLRQAADGIYGFLMANGRDEKGYWNFLVDEEGHTLIGEQSIITDAFALYALVEYYRLSGKQEALDAARQTYHSCWERLSRPGTYKTVLYPTPKGMKAHREAMQFSLMFFELGRELGDEEILERALAFSDDILNNFYRKDRRVLLEYIGLDNEARDTPEGRVMVPGHAIESLWFQIHIRSSRELDDPAAARRAAEAMRFCIEKGWDPDFGGIFLGIDADGKYPPYWHFADTKRWWVLCEALCGVLLAYEQIREDWCLQWYWKIHDWTFSHFPDREHGEWIQNLDREGRPLLQSKVSPSTVPPGKVPESTPDPDSSAGVKELASQSGASEQWINYDLYIKDPFHLPRALIVATQTFDRLTR